LRADNHNIRHSALLRPCESKMGDFPRLYSGGTGGMRGDNGLACHCVQRSVFMCQKLRLYDLPQVLDQAGFLLQADYFTKFGVKGAGKRFDGVEF
jgi:hypothetical protein